MAWNRFAD